MEFHLQTFLSAMREEQREDHKELSFKIDAVIKTLGEHHTRLTVVENTRRLLLWLGGVLGVAVVGFIFDMVNHLK